MVITLVSTLLMAALHSTLHWLCFIQLAYSIYQSRLGGQSISVSVFVGICLPWCHQTTSPFLSLSHSLSFSWTICILSLTSSLVTWPDQIYSELKHHRGHNCELLLLWPSSSLNTSHFLHIRYNLCSTTRSLVCHYLHKYNTAVVISKSVNPIWHILCLTFFFIIVGHLKFCFNLTQAHIVYLGHN